MAIVNQVVTINAEKWLSKAPHKRGIGPKFNSVLAASMYETFVQKANEQNVSFTGTHDNLIIEIFELLAKDLENKNSANSNNSNSVGNSVDNVKYFIGKGSSSKLSHKDNSIFNWLRQQEGPVDANTVSFNFNISTTEALSSLGRLVCADKVFRTSSNKYTSSKEEALA